MIKSITLITALVIGSISCANAKEDVRISLCKSEANMAQLAAELRHKHNDITHPEIMELIETIPFYRHFVFSAFKQKFVPESYFNNDQEDAIIRFKGLWFAACVKDKMKRFKLKGE